MTKLFHRYIFVQKDIQKLNSDLGVFNNAHVKDEFKSCMTTFVKNMHEVVAKMPASLEFVLLIDFFYNESKRIATKIDY